MFLGLGCTILVATLVASDGRTYPRMLRTVSPIGLILALILISLQDKRPRP
jgi:hypothetical protein